MVSGENCDISTSRLSGACSSSELPRLKLENGFGVTGGDRTHEYRGHSAGPSPLGYSHHIPGGEGRVRTDDMLRAKQPLSH